MDQSALNSRMSKKGRDKVDMNHMEEMYEEDAKKFKERMNKKIPAKALRTKGKKRRDSA